MAGNYTAGQVSVKNPGSGGGGGGGGAGAVAAAKSARKWREKTERQAPLKVVKSVVFSATKSGNSDAYDRAVKARQRRLLPRKKLFGIL